MGNSKSEQEQLFGDMRDGYQRITLGLDIGTTKIVAIIGAEEDHGQPMKILGIGTAMSDGLNRGVIVNIDKTVATLKAAINEAEQQAGLEVTKVVCGIAGIHIHSSHNSGMIAIHNPNNEIKQEDIARVLLDAQNMAITQDRQILHTIPQEYVIDGQDGVISPKGMCGVRLEARCQVITGLKTAIHNLVQCVHKAGHKVEDVVLEPLASSMSVLSEDEKEVGVALIDIGGGTTDIAIFHNKVMKFSSIIGIAGKQITNDISTILGVVSREAERIKREYGCCYEKSIQKDERFQVPGIGGIQPREILRSELAEIIRDRMSEIFELAGGEIIKSGLVEHLNAGIVITGGTTLIEGSDLLAYEIYGRPVRLGCPSALNYTGLTNKIESPIYATAMGLATYGLYSSLLPEQRIDLEIPDSSIGFLNTTAKEKNEYEKKKVKEKAPTKEKKKNSSDEGFIGKLTKFVDRI